MTTTEVSSFTSAVMLPPPPARAGAAAAAPPSPLEPRAQPEAAQLSEAPVRQRRTCAAATPRTPAAKKLLRPSPFFISPCNEAIYHGPPHHGSRKAKREPLDEARRIPPWLTELRPREASAAEVGGGDEGPRNLQRILFF